MGSSASLVCNCPNSLSIASLPVLPNFWNISCMFICVTTIEECCIFLNPLLWSFWVFLGLHHGKLHTSSFVVLLDVCVCKLACVIFYLAAHLGCVHFGSDDSVVDCHAFRSLWLTVYWSWVVSALIVYVGCNVCCVCFCIIMIFWPAFEVIQSRDIHTVLDFFWFIVGDSIFIVSSYTWVSEFITISDDEYYSILHIWCYRKHIELLYTLLGMGSWSLQTYLSSFQNIGLIKCVLLVHCPWGSAGLF